jgi:AcrR family transcriptional regulator
VRTEQARSVSRRQKIMDSALDVFARRGYRDAAMDEIATAAETSKGGVYFHFPSKQAIFLALLERMANLLQGRAEAAMAAEPDPVAKFDAALLVVVRTFASHRPLARLFLVEALGAGREFNQRMLEIHANFAGLIERHLDEVVALGVIPPLDTRIAGKAWFGALNEVVTAWVLADHPADLEQEYPALRMFLLRSVGITISEGSREVGG